jgi:hypothetical protein
MSYVVSDCGPGVLSEDRDAVLSRFSANRFCFARTSDGFVWFASRSRGIYRLTVLGYNVGAKSPVRKVDSRVRQLSLIKTAES